MSTVADRPRARRSRKPRPAPEPVAPAPVRIAEGEPPAPPVRHGKAGLTLRIGGSEYRLAPAVAPQGKGIEGLVTLRKTASDPAAGPAGYAVATDGLEIHCTCPDHERNKATCKHMMALVAVARILAPFAHAAEGGAL